MYPKYSRRSIGICKITTIVVVCLYIFIFYKILLLHMGISLKWEVYWHDGEVDAIIVMTKTKCCLQRPLWWGNEVILL